MVAYLYPHRLCEGEPISKLIVRCSTQLHNREAARVLRNSSRTAMGLNYPHAYPTIDWPTIDGHIS